MCSVDFNEAISILALNFDAPGVTLLSVIRASHEMIGYQVRRLLCMGKGYLSISGDVRHNAKQQDPFSPRPGAAPIDSLLPQTCCFSFPSPALRAFCSL